MHKIVNLAISLVVDNVVVDNVKIAAVIVELLRLGNHLGNELFAPFNPFFSVLLSVAQVLITGSKVLHAQ